MSAAYNSHDKAVLIIALKFKKANLDPNSPTYSKDVASYNKTFDKLLNLIKKWQALDDAINETIWEMPPGTIGTLRGKINNAESISELEELTKAVSKMPHCPVATHLFSYIKARERKLK